MKKIIPLALIATLALCAFDAEVKKGSVALLVNDNAVQYEIGKTFSLKAGDLVCFVSGDGRVVIKGEKYSKQISKRTKSCKRLPVKGTDKKDYLALVSDKIVAKFGKTKETAVAGVSTRSTTTSETLTDPLLLSKENKYLILESDKWGPLPVSIMIRDKKGEVIASDVNEEDVSTSFIFSRDVLKDGYTVEVVNAFDEALVKSVIRMKEGK